MLEWALVAAYAASSALFAWIALRLASGYRSLGVEELAGTAWGFALLSLSSLLGAAEFAATSPRLAVSLYVGSSSTAAAGLAVILASALTAKRAASLAVAPLVLALSADALAAALAAAAGASSRGLARAGFALLGAAHAGRAVGVLLMPGTVGELVLLASETVRAAAALVMAAYYGGVSTGSGEEE